MLLSLATAPFKRRLKRERLESAHLAWNNEEKTGDRGYFFVSFSSNLETTHGHCNLKVKVFIKVKKPVFSPCTFQPLLRCSFPPFPPWRRHKSRTREERRGHRAEEGKKFFEPPSVVSCSMAGLLEGRGGVFWWFTSKDRKRVKGERKSFLKRRKKGGRGVETV